MCRVAKLPFRQARVKSITLVVGKIYAKICSQKGNTETENHAPHKKIVEKKNAKKMLKWSISKICAVRPRAKLPSSKQPISKGTMESGVKSEVAENAMTSGKIKRRGVRPFVTAEIISLEASDWALTGGARIAS